MSTWDPARTAEFFDDYGEREWTRFEDGRTPGPSLTTHIRMLEGYVRPGDRVLDAGAGPGRFTLELLRLGAHVTALDISPRAARAAAGAGARRRGDARRHHRPLAVRRRLIRRHGLLRRPAQLRRRPSRSRGRRARARHEAGRARPRQRHGLRRRRDPLRVDPRRPRPAGRTAKQLEIARTGLLPEGEGYGHLAMRMYLWEELEELLAPHGEVVDGAAAGVLPHLEVEEPEIRACSRSSRSDSRTTQARAAAASTLIGVLRVG